MGIAASAGAVARTAGSYAAYGYGGRSGASSRSGAIEGTASWLNSRSDGLDVCYVFNTRDFGNAGAAIDTMHKEINRVLDQSHVGTYQEERARALYGHSFDQRTRPCGR